MAKNVKASILSETGKTIRIACKAADYIPWRTIKPLQGNYKKRTLADIEKLAALIIKRGVRAASAVCMVKKDIWAIDTHGRLLAYEYLESKGFIIPNIPVNWVEVANKAEAKQILLEYDSRFGKVTREGYEEFTEDFQVEEDYLSLSDIRVETETPAVKYTEKTEIIIECIDELQAEKLYGEFRERGLKCHISTL